MSKYKRRKSKSKQGIGKTLQPDRYLCEAEVVEGLESIARTEIKQVFRDEAILYPAPDVRPKPGIVRFNYNGKLESLTQLKTVIAVYLVGHFSVSRPRALLGHEHFHKLLRHISTARSLSPSGSYQSLYLNAAGSDSSIMKRIKNELAAHTGLSIAHENGDLLIRIRRPLYVEDGWETLVRLTPRPLATRPYRIHDMEGALNATVAHAMALLTSPDSDDLFLNIACGSGTLLIERLACGPSQRAIGCDINPEALHYAQINIGASGYGNNINLIQCDAYTLPMPAESVNMICADLPFGQLVGSHNENVTLYPRILEEAARIAKHRARFVLITHEIRLTEALLQQSAHWETEKVLPVTLSGLHPRIFILRRK